MSSPNPNSNPNPNPIAHKSPLRVRRRESSLSNSNPNNPSSSTAAGSGQRRRGSTLQTQQRTQTQPQDPAHGQGQGRNRSGTVAAFGSRLIGRGEPRGGTTATTAPAASASSDVAGGRRWTSLATAGSGTVNGQGTEIPDLDSDPNPNSEVLTSPPKVLTRNNDPAASSLPPPSLGPPTSGPRFRSTTVTGTTGFSPSGGRRGPPGPGDVVGGLSVPRRRARASTIAQRLREEYDGYEAPNSFNAGISSPSSGPGDGTAERGGSPGPIGGGVINEGVGEEGMVVGSSRDNNNNTNPEEHLHYDSGHLSPTSDRSEGPFNNRARSSSRASASGGGGGRARASSRASAISDEEMERSPSVRVVINRRRSGSASDVGGERTGWRRDRASSRAGGGGRKRPDSGEEEESHPLEDFGRHGSGKGGGESTTPAPPYDSHWDNNDHPNTMIPEEELDFQEHEEQREEDQHHLDHEVDLLEVVDPSVSAAAHMANIQNAIFCPPLPWLRREPVIQLEMPTPESEWGSLRERPSTVGEEEEEVEGGDTGRRQARKDASDETRVDGKRVRGEESEEDLEGLDEEDLLDLHVIKAMKSNKKQQIRKALKGVWSFMKTPLGVFFTIYGILVVFWGAGLVLILIGAIPMNSYKKKLWIEIASQILNGLFTITGIGMFPQRLIDTYHILIVSHYAHITWRRRRSRNLPDLEQPDDIPTRVRESLERESEKTKEANGKMNGDGGTASVDKAKTVESDPIECQPMLTEEEEARLRRSQIKFMHSQTWYHPHESATHRAFPISWALYICLFNDGNSIFQCGLCGVMWGLNRFNRPSWTTALLIPLSFICGIIAGILIWKGGERTKKKKEVSEAVQRIIDQRKADKERMKAERRKKKLPHLHTPLHYVHHHQKEKDSTMDRHNPHHHHHLPWRHHHDSSEDDEKQFLEPSSLTAHPDDSFTGEELNHPGRIAER